MKVLIIFLTIIGFLGMSYAEEFTEFNNLESDFFIENYDDVGFAQDLLGVTSLNEKTPRISFNNFNWSSDGSFIIFSKFQNCDSYPSISDCKWHSLYKLELKKDSKPEEIFIPNLDDKQGFLWAKISPDDSKIAFVGKIVQVEGLYVVDMKEKKITIVSSKTHLKGLDWTPSGNLLYSYATTQHSGVLQLIDERGNEIKQVYSGKPIFGDFDVSSDGEKILFSPTTKEPERSPPPDDDTFALPGHLSVYDIIEEEFFEIPIKKNISSVAKWANDSNTIYYIGSRPNPSTIERINMDGSEEKIIFQDNNIRQFWGGEYALSPDDKKLVFTIRYVDDFPSKTIFVAEMSEPSPILVASFDNGYQLGKVSLDREQYVGLEDNPTVKITVHDSDENYNSDERDVVMARLFSDSDPNGIWITLREMHHNSGNFQGKVQITSESSSRTSLHVRDGDTISIQYNDLTLPEDFKGDGALYDTATIGRLGGLVFDPNPSDFRGKETLNSSVIIIIESIGAALIIGFIIFYAMKRKMRKNN